MLLIFPPIQSGEQSGESVADIDSSLPQDGRSSTEYSKLKQSEISSGEIETPVDLSEEELGNEQNTPIEYKCKVGTKIVEKRDIGILETGTPLGKNYGGFYNWSSKESTR